MHFPRNRSNRLTTTTTRHHPVEKRWRWRWWWWRTSPRESIDLRQGFPSLGAEVGSRRGPEGGCSVGRESAMERMIMIEIGTNHRETNMQESYFEKSTSPKLLSLVSRNTVSILMDLCTVTLERTRDCYLHDVHTSAIFLLHVFTAFEH